MLLTLQIKVMRILLKRILVVLLCLCYNITIAQTKSITGVVTDSKTKEKLTGVSVFVKGTNVGTITNVEGKFIIDGDIGDNSVLVFSFIGYKTLEEDLNKRTTINVNLDADIESLKEVVVVGYGAVPKRDLTTAVTTVRSKDMLQGAFNNPMQMIDGKVSGVTVSSTAAADPNSNSSIQVRGASSIDAGNGPLVVIDGMPGGDLRNIVQQDIESITILKDGSAAAIYGSRAANGVVLIESKKGKAGRVSLMYDSFFDKDFVARRPDVLSPEEFLQHKRDIDNGARTDWYEALVRDDNFGQNHFLSASGGTSNSMFRVSANYRTKSGIDIATDRKEYGVRVNFLQKAMDGLLELGGNISYRVANEEYTNYGAFKQAVQLNPTDPIYDPSSKTGYKTYKDVYDTYNPVQDLNERENGSDQTYSIVDFLIKLNITKDLNTEVKLARQGHDQYKREYYTSRSRESEDNNRVGRARLQEEQWVDWTFEWLGNYSKLIGKHDIKFLAGYSYQEFNNRGFYAENMDFPSDAFWYNKLNAGDWNYKDGRLGMDSWKNKEKTIAFLSRVNYSYKDTYLLMASYRYEGNTKFGPNEKWGGFWAGSAAWRFSNLPVFEGSRVFTDMKLRFSTGTTGRSGFPRYSSAALYSPYGRYQNDAGRWIRVYGPGNTPNLGLKWEKQISYNLGVDYNMFSGRLSGSFDAFIRQGKDVISEYDVPVPPYLHDKITTNVASTTAKGVELSVNWNVLRKDNFSYTTTFNGSYIKSKLDKFSNGTYSKGYMDRYSLPSPGNPGYAQRLEDGVEIGSFYGFRYAGVDENGKMLIWEKATEGATKKLASDGSELDKTYIGNGMPKFEMSWGHSITWKNLDLSLFFRGRFNYKILNLYQMYYGLQAVPKINLLKDAYSRNGEITSEKVIADYFLEDGGFLKLDNITLGWTPAFNNKYLKTVRLYATVRNVFTITKFTGLDPDAIDISGLEPGIGKLDLYPITRNITLGIQVTF